MLIPKKFEIIPHRSFRYPLRHWHQRGDVEQHQVKLADVLVLPLLQRTMMMLNDEYAIA